MSAARTVTFTREEIRRRRWANQSLAAPSGGGVAALVRRFGALQAQEYVPTAWALSLRMGRVARERIEKELARGTILRTHVLRPTWHLVPRDDIRWMVELTAPHVKPILQRNHKLTPAEVRKAGNAVTKALRGGRSATRAEMKEILRAAGLGKNLDGRFWHITGTLELDALLCSGPTQGKQTTWALLEERAPRAKRLPRDEAIAELTRRYFQSHGPATAHDFAWWSGLRLRDVRAGLDATGNALRSEELEGRTYWMARRSRALPRRKPVCHLLPTYDEYLIAYKDRSAVLAPGTRDRLAFTSTVMLDGLAVGTWKATAAAKAIRLQVSLFRRLDAAGDDALRAAIERYAKFTGRPVEAKVTTARRGSAARAASLFAAARHST